MHLNSWSEAEIPGLTHILNRFHSMCPTSNFQTHLLHLASYGEILPHVDNPSSSGSWILGASLGAERIMRMEGSGDIFEVVLPSGSLYLQRYAPSFISIHIYLVMTLENQGRFAIRL